MTPETLREHSTALELADQAVVVARQALSSALQLQWRARGESDLEICEACRGSKVDVLGQMMGEKGDDGAEPPCEACGGLGTQLRRYPIVVERTVHLPGLALEPNSMGRKGWVAVRPVAEDAKGKTYLGYLLGDLALSTRARFGKDGTLSIGMAQHNPAIFVPDLGRIVLGIESWWSPVKSADDLRQITDADIHGVWYVQALREFAKLSPAEG